ncbi:hypothetical protein GCM10025875_31910 [Litorihabitans aurantiacus]|uniref:Uncharacterized protein n=1 Tax=Litorihabitans aurantiacus TaxID=1930061 RepID=A0AA37XHT5_9MICO|nr:hypothetical protein GCM10025875_31910 [Litorihabitans aurantiacus]
MRKVRTFGPVRTSKLLARKRPHLVPIYDEHIRTQFGAPHSGDQWSAWAGMFADPTLVQHLAALRRSAGVDGSVSLLRVLDVVVWMEGKHGSSVPESARTAHAEL